MVSLTKDFLKMCYIYSFLKWNIQAEKHVVQIIFSFYISCAQTAYEADFSELIYENSIRNAVRTNRSGTNQ